MSADLPAFAQLLASFPRPGDQLGFHGTWREAAVRAGLLPVYSDWECSYALTRGGEPVYACDDDWSAARPLTNARHRFIVWALAAERFPELAALRPVRRPEDPTCATCGGVGDPMPAQPGLLCECGGLGWYPAGTTLGPG